VIQFASDAAVHAHSGCALTLSVPVPPAAAMEPSTVVTVTRHLEKGPVRPSLDDDPHAMTTNAAPSAHTAAIGREMNPRVCLATMQGMRTTTPL
jgi:hypothetical protein